MAETKKYTNDDDWVVDIRDDMKRLWVIDEVGDRESCSTVCICQVPESLSSGKPEAFAPMFVGLGPYHHHRSTLTFTNDHKLGAAKRVLNLNNHNHFLQFVKSYPLLDTIIALYHPDIASTCNLDTLSYVLTVDGFFLLAFITLLTTNNHQFSYFLSGNLSVPLFNFAGQELTKNALVSEVFMLENQIPFLVLNILHRTCSGLSNGDSTIEPDRDNHVLGSMLKDFCAKHCPLVNLLELPQTKNPGDCDHLLDLMYRLAVVPPKNPQRLPSMTQSFKREATTTDKTRDCTSLVKFFKQVFEGAKKDFKRVRPYCYRCCSVCWRILVFLLLMFIIAVLIVQKIRKVISGVSRFFLGTVHKILSVPLVVLKFLATLLNHVFRALHQNLSELEADYPSLKAYVEFFGALDEVTGKHRESKLDSDEDAEDSHHPFHMIPTVMELYDAGITFQPAKEGGISSKTVRFDEEECVFYLPRLKLDVNSEVIIRNLVAYESLTKPYGLVFTRYIEMMRAIIDSAEDVRVLVDAEIINSEMRNQVIADLFNGMIKSIIRKDTQTEELDKVIQKVNAMFGILSKRKKAVRKYRSAKFMGAIAGLVLLSLTAMQAYCP